ncbi:hypothetical protein D1224_02565 [Henriciella barbarensis]|uniref:DUF3696 domain-containing protein n=1 Tax=Henriciella barbarensis TaxID=86342 RepID=A0A399R7Y7_9PROT|nr:AAA family ATPase [Henriciella barbarensis]RIJ26017.1 hypothetical protein D1224_02565 [Henriciella barbarensis]
MITELRLRNYKGFESAEISIRPLTFLVGKNSSGKTSFLQFLLALHQSHRHTRRRNPSIFEHNGPLVKFGPAQNLWRSKDTSLPLEFSVKFDDSAFKHSMFQARAAFAAWLRDHGLELADQILNYRNNADSESADARTADEALKNTEIEAKIREAIDVIDEFEDYEINFLSSMHRCAQSIFQLQEFAPDDFFVPNRKSEKFKHRGPIGFGSLRRPQISKLAESDIACCIELIDNLTNIQVRKGIFLNYELEANEQYDVYAKSIDVLTSNNRLLLGINIDNPSKEGNSIFTNIRSDFVSRNIGSFASGLNSNYIKGYLNGFLDIFSQGPDLIFESEDIPRTAALAAYIIERAQDLAFDGCMRHQVSHVPPLRAHPRRYYYEDLSSSVDDEALFTRLENSSIKKSINEWLSEFGIKIDIASLEQVIRKIIVSPNINSDLELEISDVGFGFSQVLPVIVAIISARPGSLVLVEQPEVHLHPDMQASIGNLFTRLVDKVIDGDEPIRFIVETHSEYLLTEVRAQIAKGKISSDQVSILHFTSDETGKNIVARADISETGMISWPSNFIDRHYRNQADIINSQFEVSEPKD